MCGLVGLKPSRPHLDGPAHGRVGQLGPARRVHTVRDSAAILDATIVHVPGDGVIAPRQDEPYADLVGRDPGRLRIGFLDHAIRTNTEIDPDVTRSSATAARLEALGHHVEPSVPAPLLDESRITAWGPAFAAGTAASVAAIAAEVGRELDDGDIEPWTMFIAERASMFPPAAVIGAQKAMTTFRRDTATWWADGFDLLLTPPVCVRHRCSAIWPPTSTT